MGQLSRSEMEPKNRRVDLETIQISVDRMWGDRMSEDLQEGITGAGQQEVKPEDFGLRRIELIPLTVGSKGNGDKDTSSVTLVKTPTTTVVIDTGSKERIGDLKEALKRHRINVTKVNVLVTTRIHPLHSGNDDLFVHSLQHLRREEWSKIEPGPGRKIAISDRYHWIDRYLKLEVVSFPEPGGLVLLIHIPKRPELLAEETNAYAGQTIGITGMSIPSESDPEVHSVLERIRSGKGMERPGQTSNIKTMEELLSYCDHIIPGYGPMFTVRP
jgi:hypothetical protein